ncbi:MAG: hypothetical protein WBF99_07495 [Xanthobacteraceae bacterium]
MDLKTQPDGYILHEPFNDGVAIDQSLFAVPIAIAFSGNRIGIASPSDQDCSNPLTGMGPPSSSFRAKLLVHGGRVIGPIRNVAPATY